MDKTNRIIDVKGRKIGGDRPQVCTPIVGRTEEQLIEEARAILDLKPDLIEWRVDYFEEVEEINEVLKILDKITQILVDYPLIFTCRIDIEGGFKRIEQGLRIELFKKVIETKKVDIIDIELINKEEEIKDIIDTARENGVYVIISNHDFKQTPPREEIIERLIKARVRGADIGKIAVMPNSMNDVLDLLYATNTVKEKYPEMPLITMSMSGKGLVSRIVGGVFGSSITFGSGKVASAPGQIDISQLKTALDILHKNM